MLNQKTIYRFFILWLIGTFIATIIGLLKDYVDHNFKISNSWYFIQNYRWTDELLSCAVFLFVIALCYFLMVYLLKKKARKMGLKILLFFFISFFIVPFLFPQNPFPEYLFSIEALGRYLFGLLEIGIVGTFFPLIDELILRRVLKVNKLNVRRK